MELRALRHETCFYFINRFPTLLPFRHQTDTTDMWETYVCMYVCMYGHFSIIIFTNVCCVWCVYIHTHTHFSVTVTNIAVACFSDYRDEWIKKRSFPALLTWCIEKWFRFTEIDGVARARPRPCQNRARSCDSERFKIIHTHLTMYTPWKIVKNTNDTFYTIFV